MGITKVEESKKLTIQEKKPLAFRKIQKHPEMIKNKESVALIQLQYDYKCNMKCDHCAIEKFKQNPGKQKLTVKEVKRIADQADEMGLASICISGGEPLCFPDLEDIVKAIGKERFVISMDTNGWLLTEEKIKWLVKIGVDRIHLSMDGFEGNHDEFRHKKGSWQRVVKALPFCEQYGLAVVINIVATKSLVESGQLLQQIMYVERFNQHTSIIFAKPVGTFEDSKDEILNNENIKYIQALTKKFNCSTHLSPNFGHTFGCMCFKKHFSITAFGDVLPCPWIPISMGNIFEEDLETIIRRGLNNKWFSYDRKYTCHSGNCDSKFYQEIIPQIEKASTYPADWMAIKW